MKESGDILELLKNEYFVRWVKSPTDESNHFWSIWIASDPKNKELVDAAVQLIKSSSYKIDEGISDADYNSILSAVVDHGLKVRQKSSKKNFNIWRPLSVAASVAIVVFASWWVISSETNKEQQSTSYQAVRLIEKVAENGQKITTQLPDGTVVNLNSGSKITFPSVFNGITREVTLQGEAFFDVKRNPEQPFIVKMNGDEVTVLGTSFNIRSYPDDDVVSVAVATGKVSYASPLGQEVLLKPDQMAVFSKEKKNIVTMEVDKLESFGWRSKIIYFKSSPLKNVLKELERWYGVKIEAEGDFSSIGTFTGEFRNETLNQVLKGLSYVYGFEFEIDGTEVSINQLTKNQKMPMN